MATPKKKSTKTEHDHCHSGTASYVERCLARLREEGGRISGARTSVINVLAKAERPLAPKEILERSESDSLDLASVYRNLEALEEKGLVHQIGHSGGYFPCMHSECGVKIHVLTHCESCEMTKEIHLPESLHGMLNELVAASSSALAQISKFQIEGRCRKCAKLP